MSRSYIAGSLIVCMFGSEIRWIENFREKIEECCLVKREGEKFF